MFRGFFVCFNFTSNNLILATHLNHRFDPVSLPCHSCKYYEGTREIFKSFIGNYSVGCYMSDITKFFMINRSLHP